MRLLFFFASILAFSATAATPPAAYAVIGDPCLVDEDCSEFEFCNQFSGNCACTADAACDDGLWCNGDETCIDPGNVGNCDVGTPRCVDSGQVCAEEVDRCIDCLVDQDCDDGDFCNGMETCDTSGETPVCVEGEDPCPGLNCNDDTAMCEAQCAVDADCDNFQFCDGVETCVDGGCRPGEPQCQGEDEFCNESSNTCGCTTDAYCDDGRWCNGDETCLDPGVRGICESGTQRCVDTGQVCVESLERCLDCLLDSDCSDGDFCNGMETCDTSGETPVCVEGEDPCPGLNCNDDTAMCEAQCAVDADCDNAQFCDGMETCVDGGCQDGEPPCQAQDEFCNESSNTCGCTTDAYCDDGRWCNGDETCLDPGVRGICEPGTPRCVDTGQVCAEEVDRCIDCLVDQDCDDGRFCNGMETCDTSGETPACVEGEDPCPGLNCNDDTAMCEAQCAVDADCDNAQFCDGMEACVDGGCQPGEPQCQGEDEFCNEAADRCGCETDAYCDDGSWCNGDEICNDPGGVGQCDPGAARCTDEGLVCIEEIDRCIGCVADAECSDGEFCNGMETCDTGGDAPVCVEGTDPCPGQMCNEQGETCFDSTTTTMPAPTTTLLVTTTVPVTTTVLVTTTTGGFTTTTGPTTTTSLPGVPGCSQPLSSGNKPTATDCLFILNVAVGLEICVPECICAPSGDLPVSATDSLVCLNAAIDIPTELLCPCGSSTTTTLTP